MFRFKLSIGDSVSDDPIAAIVFSENRVCVAKEHFQFAAIAGRQKLSQYARS